MPLKWNDSGVQRLQLNVLWVETQPYFKMVGMVLGLHEAAVTKVHVQRRVLKAEATAPRLHTLGLPASCSVAVADDRSARGAVRL